MRFAIALIAVLFMASFARADGGCASFFTASYAVQQQVAVPVYQQQVAVQQVAYQQVAVPTYSVAYQQVAVPVYAQVAVQRVNAVKVVAVPRRVSVVGGRRGVFRTRTVIR